ncbi:MAG: PLP-dependent aminotransferase family protein [Myxococcaceae bacterium]|nr:PLP-dependent aminotransferase family protein [Myxococcaceae bacterium]
MTATAPLPLSLPLASRMSRMTTSAVREILKVAERPDVLSFAGGLPAPELFPVEAVARAHAEVLATDGAAALQYSVTEGYGPLREWISRLMERRGLRAPAGSILVTNGSQQGLDLVGKVLLNPGDVVAVENPSYLAALQVLGGYEVQLEPLASDDEGLDVEELEALLKSGRRPKLVYVVPNFGNPKGTRLSLTRRRRLVELAQAYRVPILEDDPYGELLFSGEPLPPLAALDELGVVITLSTFSKTLAPGLRVGWMVAPPSLLKGLTIAKQAADLHTGTLVQRATARLLEDFDYAGHVERIRSAYGERCHTMHEALREFMPEGTRWTRPDGGMFLWVELPEGFSARALFKEALAERVAFVPGDAFFVREPQDRFLRLNFSNRTPAFIREGMERLGRVVQAHARTR